MQIQIDERTDTFDLNITSVFQGAVYRMMRSFTCPTAHEPKRSIVLFSGL